MSDANLVDLDEPWPALDVPGWLEAAESLQLWSQIVGKTRLALSPMVNHWWQVPLYLTARGLSTSTIPVGPHALDVELDLLSHMLVIRTSTGAFASMPLCDGPLARFYSDYLDRLRRLGVNVQLYPYAVEVAERIRLDQDPRRCRYDPDWAGRFFRALVQADRLLKQFRGRFVGKASPVHFFWGGFDLAVTRFSGRPAPPHPGGIPNVGDFVMREAYSHEVSSAGFWPGNAQFPEAAFYAYAYPEPAGFKAAPVEPAAARYEPALGEFILPYRAVRAAPDPDAAVLAFLESTYVAAADRANWDREALERHDRPEPFVPSLSTGGEVIA
jgi:hypothetical protein